MRRHDGSDSDRREGPGPMPPSLPSPRPSSEQGGTESSPDADSYLGRHSSESSKNWNLTTTPTPTTSNVWPHPSFSLSTTGSRRCLCNLSLPLESRRLTIPTTCVPSSDQNLWRLLFDRVSMDMGDRFSPLYVHLGSRFPLFLDSQTFPFPHEDTDTGRTTDPHPIPIFRTTYGAVRDRRQSHLVIATSSITAFDCA